MDTKKLRQKILDLAIHGKLVPQDPNDEPASVLLERIRAEKKRLIAEGKIKRSKKSATSDTSHYENVPFEVPEGWCWCTLDDLAFYKKGPFGSSLTKSMFVLDSPLAYKVYEQKNAIQKDHTLGSYFIDENKYKELSGFKVEPSDIIVSCAGTIGETYVMPCDIREGIINQALMLIRLHLKDIQDFYLLYFDFILKAEAAKESKGTAIKNIPPFDVLKSFFIPIPPLAEQGRILEEINKLMSFVDSIEVSTKDISSLITSAKSKILNLAIHGKLVPQDANDEPASELLKRINPKFVPCDNPHYENVPFVIPSNWVWVKLGDITNYGKCSTCSVDDIHKESWILELEDIEKDTGRVLVRHSKAERVIKGVRHSFYAGNILYSKLRTYLNKVLVAKEDGFCTTEIIPIECCDSVHPDYICNILRSKYFLDYTAQCGYGVKMPRLSTTDACKALIPLPPYKEQIRISEKIDVLMGSLNSIAETLV